MCPEYMKFGSSAQKLSPSSRSALASKSGFLTRTDASHSICIIVRASDHGAWIVDRSIVAFVVHFLFARSEFRCGVSF